MKEISFFVCLTCSWFLFSQNVTDAKGQKQGGWTKTYPKSKVYQYKGQFKDDKPVGVFTYYYPSGKMKATISHDPASNRSVGVFYHENLVVMSKGIYKDMKKDSIWLNYTTTGRLNSSETYVNDTLHGPVIAYFLPEDPNDMTKRVFSKSNYVKGQLEGEFIQYFDFGSVQLKGQYKANKREGTWERYQVNGKKMNTEYYTLGALNGWCYVYDESGKEITKSYFLFGERLEGKRLEEHLKLQQNTLNKNKN